MPGGRPTIYSDELVLEFCTRVASGRAISSVCNDADMPSHSIIYSWQSEKPEFSDKLTQAREERMETYANELRDLAARVIKEPDLEYNRVNSAVNAIDKAARLQQPKTKVIEIGNKGGKPFKTHGHLSLDATKLSDEAMEEIMSATVGNTDENE